MSKNILYFLLGIYLIAGCDNSKKGFVINGLTKGMEDSAVIYLYDEESAKDIAKTYVIDNKFELQGKVDDYAQYWIRTENFENIKSIWVENASITFDAKSYPFNLAEITGSRPQMQSEEWEQNALLWGKRRDSIYSILKQIPKSDISRIDSLKAEVKALKESQQCSEINFIKEHPDYGLSSYYLLMSKDNLSKEELKELFDLLDESVKSNLWGKTIELYAYKSTELKEGDKAIDFTLPDINGKNVSLSQFKGKIVLLDFWASWCPPCRKENPNLLKLYQKYNNQGFEIIGVSMDVKKDAWLSAIKEDSIIWTTVSDLQGDFSEVPITYNVRYIPTSYLLNREGVIIAKDLKSERLQIKLEEVFEE